LSKNYLNNGNHGKNLHILKSDYFRSGPGFKEVSTGMFDDYQIAVR